MPFSQYRIGDGEQLGWAIRFRVRCVAFLPDGQQQRVHAGGINGMHGLEPRDLGGNDGSSHVVNDFAEGGVLLRGAAHSRERPDSILAVEDCFDLQARVQMIEAVVAQMVAERTLSF